MEKLKNTTTGKQSQHSTSTYLRQEMKGTKMKTTGKKEHKAEKQIKEIGTYEVQYNGQ